MFKDCGVFFKLVSISFYVEKIKADCYCKQISSNVRKQANAIEKYRIPFEFYHKVFALSDAQLLIMTVQLTFDNKN